MSYKNDFQLDALCVMLFQNRYQEQRGVGVAEVARWLSVSKPTAQKRLNELVSSHKAMLHKEVKQGGKEKSFYYISDRAMKEFLNETAWSGRMYHSYHVFVRYIKTDTKEYLDLMQSGV